MKYSDFGISKKTTEENSEIDNYHKRPQGMHFARCKKCIYNAKTRCIFCNHMLYLHYYTGVL